MLKLNGYYKGENVVVLYDGARNTSRYCDAIKNGKLISLYAKEVVYSDLKVGDKVSVNFLTREQNEEIGLGTIAIIEDYDGRNFVEDIFVVSFDKPTKNYLAHKERYATDCYRFKESDIQFVKSVGLVVE